MKLLANVAAEIAYIAYYVAAVIACIVLPIAGLCATVDMWEHDISFACIRYTSDPNCDGIFTISDAGILLEWVWRYAIWGQFCLLGNGLIWLLMQWQEAVVFLEITSPTSFYNGWISAILTVVMTLIYVVIIGES